MRVKMKMRSILGTTVLILLMASSGAAQTERGSVGGAGLDIYVFDADGGQVIITLMWLNGGADLAMALVCGDGVEDPLTFGVAAGLLEKFARINVGVPPGLLCALAVTAIEGGSQYFLSFLAETEGAPTGFGRIGRALPPNVGHGYAAALERQLEQLERLAR